MEEMSINNTRLIKGNCMDILKNIRDKSIDLVVTDPPYKLVQGGCTNKAVRLKGATDLQSGSVFTNNSIKFSEWLPEVYRVLKENTHCYIMSNDRNLKELLVESEKVGFKLLNILVWKKTKHSPNRYYLKNAEFIVFLRKGKAININNMGSFQCVEFENVKEKTHPSDKPINMLRSFIENSSKENDLVLDPFMGAGSCGIATLIAKEKRKFIGIELDENFYNVAVNKISGFIYE